MSEACWHPQLMCCVKNIHYNLPQRTGVVYMGDTDCVDMRGCINLFTAIDDKVERILTFQGDRADTTYSKIDGEWHAMLAGRVRTGGAI
jgi:hypothetical protein